MERLPETLNWLYSLEARGEVYKLERMETALALIGNPHRRLSAVHIAGTKGKGSVAAMLDSCLRAAGLKVGLYTKPHLVNLSERTRVNGGEIPARLLLDYIQRLRAIFEGAGLGLTFFEFTVALMFLYFAEAGVDVAVIETGLGGRLDSTNVVRPFLSVVTPIGFDHMEYLGYTIPAIASEKGGIIKPGIPVVIGTRDPEARTTLLSIAARRQSAVRLIERDFHCLSLASAHRLDYRGLGLRLDDVEIGLAGPFQHENAAIALAALEAMRAQGWPISEEAIRQGMRDVYWPGRFDVVWKTPLVIIDCAHNELSVSALLESLDVELGCDVKPRLVFGCLADKNWTRMGELLGPRVRDVVLARVKPKRPLDPENLIPVFSRYVPARVEPDAMKAIDLVMNESGRDDVVLVTGSVYLAGEIYGYFLAKQGRVRLFPEAQG